ncbi:MAG: hypothetical protein MI923_01485 [Phycisphaerales bacterium]|nr:hypothetical protein [Phycisphaerales bacterium]
MVVSVRAANGFATFFDTPLAFLGVLFAFFAGERRLEPASVILRREVACLVCVDLVIGGSS